MHDSSGGFVEIRIVGNDDRVFSTHFGNDPFDPKLARLRLSSPLVDAQSNLFRAGKGDKARLGMVHDHVADLRSGSGHEIHHACRQAGFFDQLKEFVSDRRRIRRRFQNNSVAGDDCRRGHPGHNCQRKIPGRDHRADSQRNVFEMVLFAGELNERLFAAVAQHLPAVELKKIDRFRGVAVGFGPGFGDLVNHPGGQFMLAGAH